MDFQFSNKGLICSAFLPGRAHFKPGFAVSPPKFGALRTFTIVQGSLRQAVRIWQAPTYAEALRRYQRFCRCWQDEQPGLVATLERDCSIS